MKINYKVKVNGRFVLDSQGYPRNFYFKSRALAFAKIQRKKGKSAQVIVTS